MLTASNCMSDIILAITMQTAARESFSSALVKNLCLGQMPVTPCSHGESSSTTRDKPASIARYSETRVPSEVVTSFDKRTQLLIASGLVAGITPLSKRKRLPQKTLDFVSLQLAGNAAEKQSQDSLFLSDRR